ncbi:hypothetical protein KDC22_08730 [Paenibacillus tritici]|uniref:hypothetical protein n=1 Tax=Paenibacillus tritici TaxID=1873425 RepID=UPI001BA7CBA9|nr:hypothetical protein [Paenibacillus tritici]QUL56559.1 hypothetical protein KDC22_08730 [Paenibacillus tritici]
MNLNNNLITQQKIDGQLVYVLATEAFELLVNNPVIEGQPISAFDTVCNMMDFVRKYVSFSLAFYSIGNQKKWMFCLLFDNKEKLQRVQIENVQCKVCNWTGFIANPTILELYYGCPDRWGVLEEASKTPIVNCPNCNSTLPRHSIWASS